MFPSKETLVKKTLEYIDQFNQEGNFFQWTKPAEVVSRLIIRRDTSLLVPLALASRCA
ncbi:protein of unknown function [Candidatus Bipolaricaulis anaerobius]|jgi:hypothetical protein|uniref:Uncharacterized protein n=1 Tax=Candidatus Bipolaricaulis anaerobius TaxID=2026885 RepID=A0A2X3KJR7_9BACT|nr:protein of unknown function [Candidatus Bipolaricaulis anaerobius]